MSISTLSAWMTGQPCSAEENASQTVTCSEPAILTPWGTLQLVLSPQKFYSGDDDCSREPRRGSSCGAREHAHCVHRSEA